jgi:hypothetical protein
VAEARRSRIVEEVRGWWARLVVEPPGDPLPPAPPPTPAKAASPIVRVPSPAIAAPAPEHQQTPLLAPSPPRAEATPAAKREDAISRRQSRESGGENAPGRLDIEFEHHLRRGNLQVWVDGVGVVDEDFDGRLTRKILALELRQGVVQQQLAVVPGQHEVRVQVRWDDNVKSARISGRFRPGASRRLAVQVGRLRGNLSLAWK